MIYAHRTAQNLYFLVSTQRFEYFMHIHPQSSIHCFGAFIVAAVRGYMNLSCRFKAVEDDSKKLAKAQGVLLEGIYAALIGDELTVNAAAEKLRAHLFDRRKI